MTRLTTSLAAVLVTAALAILGPASEAREILGVVQDDQTGQPLPNVTVILLETADTVTTDGAGTYYFPSVPDGDVTLLVGTTNYEPQIVVAKETCCAGTSVGNVDASPDNAVTLGDLTKIIDHLFISLDPLVCWDEGNLDASQPPGEGSVTLADLTILIDHLFVSLRPLRPCP